VSLLQQKQTTNNVWIHKVISIPRQNMSH